MTQLEAQLLSILIEAPLAALLVSAAGWPSRGRLQVAIGSAVATSVTHPLLWAFVETAAPRMDYVPAVLVGEAAVVLAEAAILAWGAGLSARHSLAVSLLVNGASAAVGLVLLA